MSPNGPCFSCCLPTNLTLPSERQGRNHDPLELVMFLQFSLELPQIGSFSSAATLLRGLMHLALAQITFCIPHFNERFLAVYSPQQHGSYALRTPAPNWKASSARPDGGPTTPPPPIPLPVALQFLFFLFFFFEVLNHDWAISLATRSSQAVKQNILLLSRQFFPFCG